MMKRKTRRAHVWIKESDLRTKNTVLCLASLTVWGHEPLHRTHKGEKWVELVERRRKK